MTVFVDLPTVRHSAFYFALLSSPYPPPPMSATKQLPATSEDCRVVTTEEALAYLTQQGVRLDQAEGVTIPSQFARGYALDTGEVVVVENGWRADSPALIFATGTGFAGCC
jgi:hypothetical protein